MQVSQADLKLVEKKKVLQSVVTGIEAKKKKKIHSSQRCEIKLTHVYKENTNFMSSKLNQFNGQHINKMIDSSH